MGCAGKVHEKAAVFSIDTWCSHSPTCFGLVRLIGLSLPRERNHRSHRNCTIVRADLTGCLDQFLATRLNWGLLNRQEICFCNALLDVCVSACSYLYVCKLRATDHKCLINRTIR